MRSSLILLSVFPCGILPGYTCVGMRGIKHRTLLDFLDVLTLNLYDLALLHWRLAKIVCWLVALRPSNMRVYLRDGSVQTILRAATLR